MSEDNDWEIGKQEHIRLSDAAAEIYDSEYESANFATASYMNYEIDQLKSLIKKAPKRQIAVDLGCGTGRHSFILAQHFSAVYAYDISRNMVDVANKSKMERGQGNVLFAEADVEQEVPSIGEGLADLVSCSFGMGSFVRDLPTLFKTVRLLLKPGGVAAFSWYNNDAIVNRLNLPWEPALAARMVPGKKRLRVDFAGTSREIAAVAYSVGTLRHELELNFEDVHLSTYPTLTALFPQELFDSKEAQTLCRLVDDKLRSDVDGSAGGPYIFATAATRGRTPRIEKLGVERVEEVLRVHGIRPKRHEHQPLRTMAEVRDHFSKVDPEKMVKSVMLAKRRLDRPDPDNDDLLLCLVPANTKVNLGGLASFMNLDTSSRLYLLSTMDLERRTGFSVGAIPPFGMPKRVTTYIDARLAGLDEAWTGSGQATVSYQMKMSELRLLSHAIVGPIAKDG